MEAARIRAASSMVFLKMDFIPTGTLCHYSTAPLHHLHHHECLAQGEGESIRGGSPISCCLVRRMRTCTR